MEDRLLQHKPIIVQAHNNISSQITTNKIELSVLL